MSVNPTLKTYGRSRNVNNKYLPKHTVFPISEASSVFDALFAKNIEKRNISLGKTKKIRTRARGTVIGKLPPPGPSQLSSDDSIHFIANTTFDKLLKGPQYNSVKLCNVSQVQADSSAEHSKASEEHSSGYNTRKKPRTDYAKLHFNSARIKSNVNSKGKVTKQKVIGKKRLAKSVKVVLGHIADESTKEKAPHTSGLNSVDNSVIHSLIIEKEIKQRDQNSIELSRIIAEENKKYRDKFLNTSLVCAKKFTPIIATSLAAPRKKCNRQSSYSQLFQNGFRHFMHAENSPKYMLSSTPIPSSRQHRDIDENPDVSPITARCRSQLTYKSRLESMVESGSACEAVDSFKTPSSKKSLPDAVAVTAAKNTATLVRAAEISDKPTYDLRTSDDSRINYSSLLKRRRRSSYAQRRVKSASAVESKCDIATQRYSLTNDIKLNVEPVVVIERNLDLLDNKQTDSNTEQSHETSACPVVVLEKLSIANMKSQARNRNTRSQSLKHSRASETVDSIDLSKSLFSSPELKRSQSDSNIHCDNKISTLEISSDKETEIINESVVNLVSDTSDNVIENSRRESTRRSLYHITTRRKKIVKINPVDEVINITDSKCNRFGISLQEWERFSQSNICLIKIDQIAGDNAYQKEQSSPPNTSSTRRATPVSSIHSACNTKHSPMDKAAVRNTKSMQIAGKQSLVLKPGKQWFRSLSILRKTNVYNANLSESCNKGRKWRDSVIEILENQEGTDSTEIKCSIENDISKTENKTQSNTRRSSKRKTLKIVPLRGHSSVLRCGVSVIENSATNSTGYVSTFADESVLESFDKLSLTTDAGDREQTARQIVLKRCGQSTPVPFNDCYTQRILKKCRKIGEGVYGEVFMYKSADDKCRVMKIIPIEGALAVNGEHQKKFEEIISEIIIASELSNLRANNEFCTDGFNELLNVCCVQGKYPQQLLDLWNLYDEDRGSENDSPEIFTDDQLYIILELANGGQDLEAYRFNNAEQAYALFVQVVSSLAVAESALQFEHRDMHWGNILISPTDEPTNTFRLNGREFELATRGVKVSIIDFTLSRMTYNNCCIFNDLALDPDLFTATGDYQFEIYRLMRKRNLDDWQSFEPYSNILWLDYILDKMIHHLRYLRVSTKTHKTSIRRLTQLKKKVLTYNSATEFLNSDVLSYVFL